MRSRIWNLLRPGKDRPTRSSIAFGLVFAAVVGLGSYWEFRQSADGPREMATVIERQKAGPGYCPSGGRGRSDPKWDVTWRSENPPPGLPAEFTEEEVCNWNEVGERVEVIRVPEGRQTKVYQDVVHGGRESLEFAMWTFGIVAVFFALPIFWLGFGVSRWRQRRDGRPHAPTSARDAKPSSSRSVADMTDLTPEKLEAIQFVVNRVGAYQDGAPGGTIGDELRKGLDEAGLTLDDQHVDSLARAIDEADGTVDVASVLG
ncbi:hypothetical protein [Aeromicrobium sp. HA]|uniref:hypothetical protein n=1 Tax=Aeromicrobium sp. HA TaxID=3009077 RepID=UPI0022B05255|nr:hypothetical protein [Aeromicrobium sp. HA]